MRPHVDGIVAHRGAVADFVHERPQLTSYPIIIYQWARPVPRVGKSQPDRYIEGRVRAREAGEAR